MSQVPTNATTLAGLATRELRAAAVAVTAGDEGIAAQTEHISRLVGAVVRSTTEAVSKAAYLNQDDLMNVAGKQRLLGALPSELQAATADNLAGAETLVGIIEDFHLAALLRHDIRENRDLADEVNDVIAGLTQEEATSTLAGLAANPRYATYLAGPRGDTLRGRFRIKDPEFFRRIALESLAINGTPEQQRRSAALQELPKLRRVIGLARGARDAAAEEVQRPPARKPSEAMM